MLSIKHRKRWKNFCIKSTSSIRKTLKKIKFEGVHRGDAQRVSEIFEEKNKIQKRCIK